MLVQLRVDVAALGVGVLQLKVRRRLMLAERDPLVGRDLAEVVARAVEAAQIARLRRGELRGSRPRCCICRLDWCSGGALL